MKDIDKGLTMSTHRIPKRKDVLTTGQVSRICKVAPRTVCKWFDSGLLKGYRIPSSGDRRIPITGLVRFMKTYNMPTKMLGTE
jgi:two-component system response regulator RpaA